MLMAKVKAEIGINTISAVSTVTNKNKKLKVACKTIIPKSEKKFRKACQLTVLLVT